MRNLNAIRPFSLILLVLFLTAACNPISSSEPAADLAIPTAILPAQAPDTQPEDTAPTPTVELPAPPTIPAISEEPPPLAIQPTTEATPQPTTTPHYRVSFVAANDTLNVRSGPGVANDIVGELAPDVAGVQISGSGQLVSGSTWVPITAGGLNGWVNGRFLTGGLDSDTFCQDDVVDDLLMDLATAVANQDGNLLAQLVHPERGLRIHQSWWNPEVKLQQADITTLFTSNTQHDWGIQDGSGNPIVGSFSQEILPLLQEDLLLATGTDCDNIIHGGTARFVRLPDGYDAVHYYSLHRPGTDEFAGMNWGTWVVGIEQWQGEHTISYLVHFQWEI